MKIRRLMVQIPGYVALYVLGLLTQSVRGKGIGGNVGYVDHNIYLGYALSGPELKEQIGTLYYEFRIAWIYPLRLAIDAFGAAGPIILTRATAAAIPVVILAIVRRCDVDKTWLRGGSLALAFLVMSPIQAIAAETYTAGGSLLLLLLLCALLMTPIDSLSRSRNLIIGVTVASLFALHEFNMVPALFLLGGSLFYRFFTRPSNWLRILRSETSFQLLGLVLGLGIWEAVYSIYYRQGFLRPGLSIGKLKIAKDLSGLNRWEGYPGLIETIIQSPNAIQYVAPLVAGILGLVMLARFRSRKRTLVSLSQHRQVLILCLASAHFASLLFVWLILHAPIFSEYFYFSLSLVGFLLLGVFVSVSRFWKLPALVWLIFWLVAVAPTTITVSVLSFLGLNVSELEQGGYPVLAVALIIALIALIEHWKKSPDLWIAITVFVLWLPISAGNNPYYLLNHYRGDRHVEQQYVSDIMTLNDLWRASSRLGLTAVWNESDVYLNSMQASLAFGSTRLDGLGGSSSLPTLENWTCGRFWGARKLESSCEFKGRDLGQRPDSILALSQSPTSIEETELEVRMNSLGYYFSGKEMFQNSSLVVSTWRRSPLPSSE